MCRLRRRSEVAGSDSAGETEPEVVEAWRSGSMQPSQRRPSNGSEAPSSLARPDSRMLAPKRPWRSQGTDAAM